MISWFQSSNRGISQANNPVQIPPETKNEVAKTLHAPQIVMNNLKIPGNDVNLTLKATSATRASMIVVTNWQNA